MDAAPEPRQDGYAERSVFGQDGTSIWLLAITVNVTTTMRIGVICLSVLGFGISSAWGQVSLSHRLTPVPIQQVVIQDEFWAPKRQVWREVTIPDCFAKFEKDGALSNFDKIRDGTGGQHGGLPWFDGLIYEMICGTADFLQAQPDPAMEVRLDGYIDRIAAAAAKDPDGYLNTFTQLKEPNHRWGLNGGNDRWLHDVYNASAMVEAAVHYYRATGKVRLLEVATRFASHMADLMGPPPRKNRHLDLATRSHFVVHYGAWRRR
jgi:DUF1680 family protein